MSNKDQFMVCLNYLDTDVFTEADKGEVQLKPGEYFGYEPSGEADRLLSEWTGAKAVRNVMIRDVRFLPPFDTPQLKTSGFELVTDNLGALGCTLYNAPDLSLENSGRYVDELESMIKNQIETRLEFKVKIVSVFDLAKRRSGSSNNEELPLSFIHSDYTSKSGVERLKQQAFSSADTLAPVVFKPLQNRFQNSEKLIQYIKRNSRFLIINVWRNADHSERPIAQDPIAVCDPSTVPKESFVNYEIRCPGGLSLYEYHISGGNNDCKSHKWYFYSRMTVDESLMWISHDSNGEYSSVPHTAFTIPNNVAGERKSIEARAFVFLENENT